MATDAPTYESMLAEISDALQRDTRTPTGIRLGQLQRDVIQRHVQESSGLADVGPITSFAGLELLRSTSADKLELVWAGDQEPPPAPVQSGPEAQPAQEQPSGG